MIIKLRAIALFVISFQRIEENYWIDDDVDFY